MLVEHGQNLLQGFFRGIDKGKEREQDRGGEAGRRQGNEPGFVEQLFSKVLGNCGDREVGIEELGGGRFEDRGSVELEIGKEIEEDKGRKRVREEDFPWFEEAKRAKQTLTVSKQKTRNTIERARSSRCLGSRCPRMSHKLPQIGMEQPVSRQHN